MKCEGAIGIRIALFNKGTNVSQYQYPDPDYFPQISTVPILFVSGNPTEAQ